MNRYYDRVARRAENRCEYCRAPEIVFNMRFEVDHIIPRSRGGANTLENLALSCPICNVLKSDHESGTEGAGMNASDLFHPRTEQWADHFAFNMQTAEIEGITAKGRATVDRLRMNRSHQLNARHRWIKLELFP
jgi:hypothetical protein